MGLIATCKLSFLAVILILISHITEAQVSSRNLEKAFEDSNLPSVVFGTVDKDGSMEFLSFGSAVWGEEANVGKDNIHRIASMSKAITSVAAMQLVEQGIIGLDDPLNDLMPEMVSIPILTAKGELISSNSPITLRHLLTHTSGFGYGFIEKRLQNFNRENWTHEDYPRMSEPGEIWRYGTSTDWAGKVVEKLSGKDLETYFRDHITGPLNMNSTWFNVPENLQDKIVSYGQKSQQGLNEFPRIPARTVKSYSGGGGLFSSPEDYLKFIHCVLKEGKHEEGQILKPETIKLLFESQLPDNLYVRINISEDGQLDGKEDESLAENHSLAWALSKRTASEDPEKRNNTSKKAGFWSGLYNTHYTIEPKHGFGVVTFLNFLPAGNKDAYELHQLYENSIYSSYDK